MCIQTLVADFAKTNKISKAKLEGLVQAVLAEATITHKPSGRKTTDESIRLREALVSEIALRAGTQFTIKDLCSKLQALQTYVNNNLSWLVKHNIVKASKCGKCEAVWQAV